MDRFASLLELEKARKVIHLARPSDDLQKTFALPKYVRLISLSLGAEALSRLVKLLLELFAELKVNRVTAIHV